MARHKTTLDQFPAIIAQLPRRFQDAAVVGLRSASQRLIGYTVEEIIAGEVVASGELSRSVRSYNLPDGAYTIVEAPHAMPVEKGSRPHWAPLQPLIDWVIAKGIARDPEQAKQIARRVQAAIARRGTRPRHYFAKAVARIKPEIIKHIMAEWNRL